MSFPSRASGSDVQVGFEKRTKDGNFSSVFYTFSPKPEESRIYGFEKGFKLQFKMLFKIKIILLQKIIHFFKNLSNDRKKLEVAF